MKIVLESLSGGQSVGVADPVGAGITRTVNRTIDLIRFASDIFHDVDLAAVWPTDCRNIAAQHPKSRPNPISVRQFQTRFHPSVGEIKALSGQDACRSIFTRPIPAVQ